MTQAQAGWYPLPDGTQRYWDGSVWTEHVAPGAVIAEPPAPPVVEAPPAPPAPPVVAAQPVLAAHPALAAPAANAYAELPANVPAGVATAKPRRRVWPWILGILGVLIVIGVVAVVAFVMLIGKAVAGPKSAADDFNTSYLSGDCEAYLAVTTSNFRDGDGYPGTCDDAATAGYFPVADGATWSISLDGVESSGSSATVTGTLSTPDQGDTSLTYSLIKVDGKWLVDSID